MGIDMPINLPLFNIVRYRKDGAYDCIWSANHTLRDALKKCKELNEDYHRDYGVYVVEDGYGNAIHEYKHKEVGD